MKLKLCGLMVAAALLVAALASPASADGGILVPACAGTPANPCYTGSPKA